MSSLGWNPGLPWSLSGKVSACNAGDVALIPGTGRSPGEGNSTFLQYSSVFLPGNTYGQRSLASYRPWGCKESDTTEQVNNKDTKRVGPNLI